jgi:polyferredoxin
MASSTLPPTDCASVAQRPAPVERTKKKIEVRRRVKNHERRLRWTVQAFFLLLNFYLGIQFYAWVRQFETGAYRGIERPGGIDGWLPIAGIMNLRVFLSTGEFPLAHPATLFLTTAFLTLSFVFRKSFCSWICPIGSIEEYLARFGKKLLGRNFALPKWIDVPLRAIKYLLLGFFVYIIGTMSVIGIKQFLIAPYGLIADVKLMNFFREFTPGLALTIGILLTGSMLIQNFWCRYACPYGALMGIFSMLSPVRITRNAELCVDCGKCNKACPSQLKVDTLVQIRSAECIGCLECVMACPAEGALDMKLLANTPLERRVQPWMIAAGIAVIFFGLVAYAKITDRWQTKVPPQVYQELIQNSDSYSH